MNGAGITFRTRTEDDPEPPIGAASAYIKQYESELERAMAALEGPVVYADGYTPGDVSPFALEQIPIDAYADGASTADISEQAPQPTQDLGTIQFKRAADIAQQPTRAEWLMRPYIERNVLALLFGELGTLKSFVALEFALSIASGQPSQAFQNARVKRGKVVYISAEGKGLWRRLKGWSIARGIDLADVDLWAIERPIDTFSEASLCALAEAINGLGITPDLIIIDTLSRNAGAADENKTADMTAYLNGLDKLLRVPMGASILLVHHVGHMAKERARGSYALMANTDANYLIERPDPSSLVIELKTGRLKDSDSPPPVALIGRVVELGSVDEDGEPETTLVIDSTTEKPKRKKTEPSTKNQAAALAAIRAGTAANKHGVLTQEEAVRIVRTGTDMPRNRAHEAVEGLIKNGYIKHSPMGGLEVIFDE